MEDYKNKYEEALERAKTLHKLACETQYDNTRLAIEELFPELKESEDLKIKRDIQYAVRCAYGDNSNNTNSIFAWLEKQGEQKPAWSEEDEMMLEAVLDKIGDFGTGEMCKDWLKSLKERYTWKPSDEQIKALNYIINLMASSESPTENDYYYNVFKDMRTQLKKLR